MKLLIEVLAGVLACGAAYYLARPDGTAQRAAMRSALGASEEADREASAAVASRPSVPGVPAPRAIGAPQITTSTGLDGAASIEQERAMNLLRNEVIRAAAKDMNLRNADILACLDSVQLAGVEKLRFSVEVVSKPAEATTVRWRFVEIVEGEPLPDSFPACAARAFGGGQQLAPPPDARFPEFSGELSVVYTIPVPATNTAHGEEPDER